jgi:hypothetical protein
MGHKLTKEFGNQKSGMMLAKDRWPELPRAGKDPGI